MSQSRPYEVVSDAGGNGTQTTIPYDGILTDVSLVYHVLADSGSNVLITIPRGNSFDGTVLNVTGNTSQVFSPSRLLHDVLGADTAARGYWTANRNKFTIVITAAGAALDPAVTVVFNGVT